MNFLTIDVFLIIFIGMGPVKVLLLYIAATKDASREVQRKIALKAIMTAAVVGNSSRPSQSAARNISASKLAW